VDQQACYTLVKRALAGDGSQLVVQACSLCRPANSPACFEGSTCAMWRRLTLRDHMDTAAMLRACFRRCANNWYYHLARVPGRRKASPPRQRPGQRVVRRLICHDLPNGLSGTRSGQRTARRFPLTIPALA
jgi:hypothetical protein